MNYPEILHAIEMDLLEKIRNRNNSISNESSLFTLQEMLLSELINV